MLNEAYEAGQVEALEMLVKVAGEEFAEKVAGKGTEAAKKLYGSAKEKVGKGYKAFKKYHSGATKDIKGKGEMFGKAKDKDKGGKKYTFRRDPAKAGTKARSVGRGLAKFTPHAAAAGAAGAGAYMGLKKKDKK